MLHLGTTYGLEDVGLLWAGEVHYDLAIVCSQAKCRVIFGLYRRRRFINIAQSENIIDSRTEPETLVNLLLLRRCDLNKLTSDLDEDFNFALGLGESRDGLEHVSGIRHHTDRLLWKMELAEMEMGLQVL